MGRSGSLPSRKRKAAGDCKVTDRMIQVLESTCYWLHKWARGFAWVFRKFNAINRGSNAAQIFIEQKQPSAMSIASKHRLSRNN